MKAGVSRIFVGYGAEFGGGIVIPWGGNCGMFMGFGVLYEKINKNREVSPVYVLIVTLIVDGCHKAFI